LNRVQLLDHDDALFLLYFIFLVFFSFSAKLVRNRETDGGPPEEGPPWENWRKENQLVGCLLPSVVDSLKGNADNDFDFG